MVPKKPNKAWIDKARESLNLMAGGSANPFYAEKVAEIEEAETRLALRLAFEAWARTEFGKLNEHPTRHGGQRFEAGQVFMKDKKVTGAIEEVWEKYQAAQNKAGA